MKIIISTKNIRLRLTKDDINKLITEGKLLFSTPVINCVIESVKAVKEGRNFIWHKEGQYWQVAILDTILADIAKAKPSKDGILIAKETIEVYLEVDIKDKK